MRLLHIHSLLNIFYNYWYIKINKIGESLQNKSGLSFAVRHRLRYWNRFTFGMRSKLNQTKLCFTESSNWIKILAQHVTRLLKLIIIPKRKYFCSAYSPTTMSGVHRWKNVWTLRTASMLTVFASSVSADLVFCILLRNGNGHFEANFEIYCFCLSHVKELSEYVLHLRSWCLRTR